MVALLAGQRTCDPQIAGSGWVPLRSGLGARYLHLCASVTKEHNLIPEKGVMISLAGKVTVGRVESNVSLPPGL